MNKKPHDNPDVAALRSLADAQIAESQANANTYQSGLSKTGANFLIQETLLLEKYDEEWAKLGKETAVMFGERFLPIGTTSAQVITPTEKATYRSKSKPQPGKEYLGGVDVRLPANANTYTALRNNVLWLRPHTQSASAATSLPLGDQRYSRLAAYDHKTQLPFVVVGEHSDGDISEMVLLSLRARGRHVAFEPKLFTTTMWQENWEAVRAHQRELKIRGLSAAELKTQASRGTSTMLFGQSADGAVVLRPGTHKKAFSDKKVISNDGLGDRPGKKRPPHFSATQPRLLTGTIEGYDDLSKYRVFEQLSHLAVEFGHVKQWMRLRDRQLSKAPTNPIEQLDATTE